MYRLGHSASDVFACLPRCITSLRSQPPQRGEATRKPFRGRADVVDSDLISDSLISESLRHRFDQGMVQPCSDFVTDMDSRVDPPEAHDTILWF